MRTFWNIALLIAMLCLLGIGKKLPFYLHLSKTAIFLQYFANKALHLAVQYTKMSALESYKESYEKV